MMDQILSAYNLTQHKLVIKPFGNGLINTTWRIRNEHEDYILQKINHSIFKNPAAIAFNVKLLAEYLALHYPDFVFIHPIKTVNNEENFFMDGKGYFRLYKYVAASHTIDAVEKPGQAFEAARKFGQFTRLLADFPIENLQITLPDFHNLSLRYEQFLSALESGNKNRIQKAKHLVDFAIAQKNIVDEYENILQNPAFKLRVTHHDTKISNVLFDGEEKGIGVIDLDTTMAGYFISDVGDMVRTYISPANEEEKDFTKIEVREAYFDAIMRGYLTEMDDELSNEEKNHFVYAGQFMIYMQALRFLTDHISNDVYYGAAYEDHNLVRAGNQVDLLKKYLDKTDILKSILDNFSPTGQDAF